MQRIPIAPDVMLLTAVVDNWKLILELASEVRALSPRLDGIKNRLEKGEAFGWWMRKSRRPEKFEEESGSGSEAA